MAKRKQAAAATDDFTPPSSPQSPEITTPPAPESPASADVSPQAARNPRPLTPDPFAFKTVNLDGYKIHFQHSRQSGEFQIRFGDGSLDDMPPEVIRNFVKAKKIEVENKDGEKKEVQLFHWNVDDSAWGMRIPFNRDASDQENKIAADTARITAKAFFEEVVKVVAKDRQERREHGELPSLKEASPAI
jgi:hypothetical protein